MINWMRKRRESVAAVPVHPGDDGMTLQHKRTPDGDNLVAIDALRVLIFREEEHWVAQGLDLDYVAAGSSLEDVTKRFATGLCHTIEAHLEKYNSLDMLIRPAPREVWQQYFRSKGEGTLRLSVASFPDCGPSPATQQKQTRAPYTQLAFLQPAHA